MSPREVIYDKFTRSISPREVIYDKYTTEEALVQGR